MLTQGEAGITEAKKLEGLMECSFWDGTSPPYPYHVMSSGMAMAMRYRCVRARATTTHGLGLLAKYFFFLREYQIPKLSMVKFTDHEAGFFW